MSEPDDDPGRDHLHGGDQFVTERNEEDHVEDRKHQGIAGPKTQRRDDRELKHRHRRSLRAEIETSEPRKQPDEARSRQTDQARPPDPRCDRSHLLPTHRDQPAEYQRHQQDMIVGGTVPPLPQHIGPVATCQNDQRRGDKGQTLQRRLPLTRDGARTGFGSAAHRHSGFMRHCASRPSIAAVPVAGGRPIARPNSCAPARICERTWQSQIASQDWWTG